MSVRKSNKKNMKRTNKKVKQSRRKMTRKLRKGGKWYNIFNIFKKKDVKEPVETNRYMRDSNVTPNIQERPVQVRPLYQGNTPSQQNNTPQMDYETPEILKYGTPEQLYPTVKK